MPIKKKENEIVTVPNTSLVEASVVDLQKAIDIEVQKRQIMERYIADNLKEGVDYGTIKITSRKTGRTVETKPTLFKAGAERICALLRVRPAFRKDIEVWEMLGSQAGVVAFVCELISLEGKVVGEGRGACTVAEKGDVNNCIKIAEKRAQIDAVLRTSGLSDRYTQDLEDMQQPPVRASIPASPIKTQPEPDWGDTAQESTPDETKYIYTPAGFMLSKAFYAKAKQMGLDAGRAHDIAVQKFSLNSYTDITKDQLLALMQALDKKGEALRQKQQQDSAAFEGMNY